MNLILFDDRSRDNLLPLTFTRPVAELRIGILTMRERWEKLTGWPCSYLTQDYLSARYPCLIAEKNLLVNASVIPDQEMAGEIRNLQPNQALMLDNDLVAVCLGRQQTETFDYKNTGQFKRTNISKNYLKLEYPWNIFSYNGASIELDFKLLTKGRISEPIPDTMQVLGKENIFIETGAKMNFSIINATLGPVYIGKDSEIMENCVIRGPFALCEGGVLKMGAKIYGPTTIGPHSKIGGECNNVVVYANSNKAHDGFLGNAVLGEWCNLGADTNNSNLKNNYAEVKAWNYTQEKFIKTGLQFCGLIMGDHSKSGINTMFNTGTVVGVSANIFGAGFPRNFIPSFSWGGNAGMTEYKIENVYEVASKVLQRRGQTLSDIDKDILRHIFQITAKYRAF